MPVTIGGKAQPDYTPLGVKVKRALGFSKTSKDVRLPAKGESLSDLRELGRKAGQGIKQGRELLNKYRSPSKR
jgi:hypothetical protein